MIASLRTFVAAGLMGIAALGGLRAHAAPPATAPPGNTTGAAGTAAPAATARSRPTVAVTIPPQRWLVERLAGDAVDVVVVIDAGMNHETYQPTDKQASDVLKASLYFTVGLPLERSRWFNAIRNRLAVVDCTVGVAPRTLEDHVCGEHDHDHGHGHGHGHGPESRDPHIWTAPGPLRTQARTMSDALVRLLPDRAAELRARHAALDLELESLDVELRRTLEPCRGKALFVFHPAWGYFTDAYGLTQVAIEHDGKAPADAELTALQRRARESGAKVIFVQPQISSRAANAVATAVGGRVESIDPLVLDVPANLRRVAALIAESCR